MEANLRPVAEQEEADEIIVSDSGSSTEVEEDEEGDLELVEPQYGINATALNQTQTRMRFVVETSALQTSSSRPDRPDVSDRAVVAHPPHLQLQMLSTSEPSLSGAEEQTGVEMMILDSDFVALPNTTQSVDAPSASASRQNSAVTDATVAMQTEGVSDAAAPVKCEPSVLSSDAASPPPGETEDEVDDGEAETCSICFESWTTTGSHRLATLRCGHLFGFSCIKRWLLGQGAKCPQCNKKAKRSDIVVLYTSRLRAVDNGEQEALKRTLEQERSLRRKAELDTAQCRQRLQMLTDECGTLRKNLQELKALMAQTGCSSSQGSGPFSVGWPQHQESAAGVQVGGQYTFTKAVMVSQAGECRVMSYCKPLRILVASQPSPHSALMPGCGIKVVSVVDMKAHQYLPIHAKQIRSLAFSQQMDSLLLSASLDNTVKLTSLLTNTVVQTYHASRPVWSCCWCLDNINYVYAGLVNGTILVYDTRNTSTHVQELVPVGNRCPIVSLNYIPQTSSCYLPHGGLVAGSLEESCFWEQIDSATYRPHVLLSDTGSCIDVAVEPESRHCLFTYRPGRSNPCVRHVLMELRRGIQQDAGVEPVCYCKPVRTFSSGPTCTLLTRSAIFPSPAGQGSMLVCVGDEASTSTMIWDSDSGTQIQKLPADQPVLGICPFEVNQEHYMASLTARMLKFYKWGQP